MQVSAAAQTELEQKFRAAVIIVASQIAAAVALIVFAFLFVKNTGEPASYETLMPLWIGVLFVAVGAFLLRRRLFNWNRLKDIALLKGRSGLLQTLRKNAILLAAMAELIAVIGFVIAFFSSNAWEMLRAGAIALLVFAVGFPRKSVWTKIVSAFEDTESGSKGN